MNCTHIKEHDIRMSEGTSRHLVITVKNQQGRAENLTGFSAYLYIGNNKNVAERICDVSDNEISVDILPEDTISQKTANYEIRIYKDKEVYEVIRGVITIDSSIHPYPRR